MPYYQALSRFFLLVVCLVMQNSVNGLNLSKSQCSYVWLPLSLSLFLSKYRSVPFAYPLKWRRDRCVPVELVVFNWFSLSALQFQIFYAPLVMLDVLSTLGSPSSPRWPRVFAQKSGASARLLVNSFLPLSAVPKWTVYILSIYFFLFFRSSLASASSMKTRVYDSITAHRGGRKANANDMRRMCAP